MHNGETHTHTHTHTHRAHIQCLLYMKALNYMDTSSFVLHAASPSPPATEITQNNNVENHIPISTCIIHQSSKFPPSSLGSFRGRHIWHQTTGGHIHNNTYKHIF